MCPGKFLNLSEPDVLHLCHVELVVPSSREDGMRRCVENSAPGPPCVSEDFQVLLVQAVLFS